VPRLKEALVLLFAGGMELCWLYGLAFFFFYLLASGQFPPAGGFFAFWIAAMLGFCTRDRGWRIIHILMLHLAGFALTLWGVAYSCGNWSVPFFSIKWLKEAGAAFQDYAWGLPFVFIALFAALFWLGGVSFAGRRTTYSAITSRFDLGVGMFFFLFLLEGGLGGQVPAMPFFLFLFFLCSMISIALARSRGSGKKEYPLNFGRLIFVFLLSLAMLLFAAGAVLLFLPGMSLLAETGYGFGKQVFSPLSNFLLKVLFFLFRRRSLRQEPAVAGESSRDFFMKEAAVEHEVQLWEKLFSLGMCVLLGLVVIIAAGWFFYQLYLWLFSRTPGHRKKFFWQDLLSPFVIIWEKCRSAFFCITGLFSPSVERGEGSRAYKKLLLWGKSSGFPRRPTETPREYGIRLGKYFPLFREEISSIIKGYHDEVYGELKLSYAQEREIKLAWLRLASPLRWPTRLKTRLFWAVRSQEQERQS